MSKSEKEVLCKMSESESDLEYKGKEGEGSVCLGVSAYCVCGGFSYVGTLVFEMC